ncbi:MAG: hypothetical protein IBX44_01470 [Sulfurospirillum sp.]|nr:hypothetical protein [Sulfurospirillum sp.]
MNDKQSLLSHYDDAQKKEKNIEFKTLLLVYASLIVAFLAILPKVYIKNQIYYTSRDISKLKSEYSILEEEHRYLKQKLESIRFKNQIIDSALIDLKD